MKLFNRMTTSEIAIDLLSNKEYIFLYANPKTKDGLEKRGTRMQEVLHPLRFFEIEYFCKGVSEENKIQEGFHVKALEKTVQTFDSLRKKEICGFLEMLYSKSKVLVVDFTLMNTRFLGAFCAVLGMYQWKELFFCYTEPGKYKKDNQDKFDLKNTTMGFEQIPNLETFSDSSTECDWVVFLGFEGSRLMRLVEEAPATRRYSIPYISIPAMKTCWHNAAMDANRQFFELKIGNQGRLDFVSAINPFETYERLIRLKSNNANVRLVVSPIGPKPVILGCIMYVLENEDEMLLFDNPLQEGNNTEDYGDSHFYDLSQFLLKVKNKRFLL